jgi:hypothetical protein
MGVLMQTFYWAWRGKEMAYRPQSVTMDAEGWCEVEAPRRGYVVYGE